LKKIAPENSFYANGFKVTKYGVEQLFCGVISKNMTLVLKNLI